MLHLTSRATDIGRLEKYGRGACIKQSIRSIAHFDKSGGVDDRGVEEAIAGSDAALASTANQLAKKAIGGRGRIRKPESGRKVLVPDRSKRPGNTRIKRNEKSGGCSRKRLRLLALDQSLQLVLGVVIGRADFPTQAVVDGQGRPDAPAILYIKSVILGARVEELKARLNEALWGPEEIVAKIKAGFLAIERKLAVLSVRITLVDLVVVKIAAKLDTVGTDDLGVSCR